jgi:hypothetical protein
LLKEAPGFAGFWEIRDFDFWGAQAAGLLVSAARRNNLSENILA